MPQTRSAKTAVSLQISQHGEEATGPNNASPPPPAASFKKALSKYRLDGPRKSASVPVPRKAGVKRAQVMDPDQEQEVSVGASTAAPVPRPAAATAKKRKTNSKYAPPSKYAHLSPLVDILEPNLIGVFVGFNPGQATAKAGHAYAHPSNHFWKLLHSSGITDRRLKPEEDRSLPGLYCMGNTNIVSRPSKDTAELTKDEMSAGTADLDAKFVEFKPEAICIVGKSIWEAIWRYRHGKNMKKTEFKYGWQDEEHNLGKSRGGEEELDSEGGVWKGSRVFVATATSGLAASLKPAEKQAIWKPFGEWVEMRRRERGFKPKVGEGEGEV